MQSDPDAFRELWRLSLVSVGTSDDLRLLVPMMVAAGSDYFGRDTQERVKVRVSEVDPRVRQLKSTHSEGPSSAASGR